MRRWLAKLGVTVIVLSLVWGLAIPALAQVREPQVLSLNQIEAYRNSIELLDSLYLFTYEIDYTTNPTYGGVDDTFLFRLMNGAVELGSAEAEPFFDQGYDIGLVSIYFDAASAPPWNGAYTAEVMGKPTLHWMDTTAVTAMDSAQADDGGVLTDETVASNDAVVNDMNLLPNPVAVNDAYYFGSNGMFDILTINIGTSGAWVGTYTWEFWNGSAWTAVTSLTDNTVGFTAAPGYHDVTYTVPEDWQTATVNGVTAYYLRFRVVSRVAPGPAEVVGLGTQSWTNTLTNPPSTDTAAFSLWYDGGTVLATSDRLTARIRAIAQTFENDWGGTNDLIEEIAGEQKLTDLGEQYFTAVIPGLRTMCPDLFADVLTTPDFPEKRGGGSSCTGGDNIDHDVLGVNWFAQIFTPDQTETVTGIMIKALRIGNPTTVTASIRATALDLPAGADLVVGTVDGDTFTTSVQGGWYIVPFTADVTLTGGTEYSIVVRALAAGVVNYAGWRARTEAYAGAAASYFVIGTPIPSYYYIAPVAGGGFNLIGPASYGAVCAGQACQSVNSGVAWAAINFGSEDFMMQTLLREGFSYSLRNRLASRLIGTKFDMTNLGASFGLSRMWMSAIIWLIFGVTLPTVFMVRAARSFKPATLTVMFLLPLGAWLGFVYLEVAVLAAFLAAAGSIYVFFFSKSG